MQSKACEFAPVCDKPGCVCTLHCTTDHAKFLQGGVMGDPYCCWASHDHTARL
jgi:hypothetical protein